MLTPRTLSLLLIGLGLNTYIHSQNLPGNIYELYEITTGGCSLDAPQTGAGSEIAEAPAIGMEAPGSFGSPPPPPPAPAAPEQYKAQLEAVLPGLQKAFTRVPADELSISRSLPNGNQCFRENGKWGLRKKDGTLLLSPRFQYVLVDTFSNNFAGYTTNKANWYSGTDGKALFQKDYYYVKEVAPEAVIVQGKKGFGLFYKNELILDPIYAAIRNRKTRYELKDQDGNFTYLLTDYKTVLKDPKRNSGSWTGAHYLLEYANFIDLKERRRLLCERGFNIRLISAKHQLLSIKRDKESFLFLIDFKGNIKANQNFTRLNFFGKGDSAIASILNKNSSSRNDKYLMGLLGADGAWIIPPIYSRLTDKGDYIIAEDFEKNKGLLSKEGTIVIPFQYTHIHRVDAQQYLCYQTKPPSKLIQVSNGTTLKEQLPYTNLRPFEWCETAAYIAEYPLEEPQTVESFSQGGSKMTSTHRMGTKVIDSNFNPITPMLFRIKKMGVYNIGYTGNEQNQAIKQIFTCDGSLQEFKINNQSVQDFKHVGGFSKENIYVQLPDNTPYLINKEGKAIAFDYILQSQKAAKYSDWQWIETGENYKNKRKGLATSDGTIILAPIFKELSTYRDASGLFWFELAKNQQGLLQPDGTLLNDRLYPSIKYLFWGLYMVGEGPEEERKYGIIDRTGKEIIPMQYDSFLKAGGLITGFQGSKKYVFDRKGNPVD